MTTGTGIAIAGVWLGTGALALSRKMDSESLGGAFVIAAIVTACLA